MVSSSLRRPAANAASRAFGASLVLGLIGLAWAGLVLSRALETWRTSAARPSHEILLLGVRLSYPAANAGAIIVLVLAALGLLVLAAGTRGLVRELLAARRFRHALRTRQPFELGRAWIIAGERPQAFCAGLLRPRVYLTIGALELLDASELAVVIAHEHHHARRRDPLRLACARVLADALFFLPLMRVMTDRQRALAEIGADEAAMLDGAGERSALASAMLSFSRAGGGEGVGLDPARVDFLLGEERPLGLPIALCAGAGVALSALTAAVVLAAQTAAGSLTLGLPLLSAQPCVVILASVPATTSLLGFHYRRRRSG